MKPAPGSVYVFPMRKDTYVWHCDSAREAEHILLKALTEYEEKYPYRYGIKKAQVQTTYFKDMMNVYDKNPDAPGRTGKFEASG